MEARLLGAGDEELFERFLEQHRDSSMFLRSNARAMGLAYEGKPLQATYLGAFDGGELSGVVGHAQSGNLLLQAPRHAAELAERAVSESGRAVKGFLGPVAQVRAARAALGLESAPAWLAAEESLHGLELVDLITPQALVEGRVAWRAPRAEERDVLRAWRYEFEIESNGASRSEETREKAARILDALLAAGLVWVATAHDEPVSVAVYNAVLPDMVQIGGVYTPPFLRGRGHAKVAVAGSLLAARAQGVTRATLFTANPSAERCYRALGFEQVGDYGIVLLR